MNRLVRAELFKLRTTSAWWLFTAAIAVSTITVLIVNAVNAYSLLKPFAAFVDLQSHGHGSDVPADFLAHLHDEWAAGHDGIAQAGLLYTSGQLVGVLLVSLLAIVLVTSEFYQQTATGTFLQTPQRRTVMQAKLIAALTIAGAAWLASTVVSVVAGAIFLHSQGYGTGLGTWAVDRAILLNLAAYLLWALFGIGFGALIRNQLTATVSATVLYLIGSTAAGTVFDLLHTYVLNANWVLAAQVIVPSVASTVMVSATSAFDQSPPAWVGALVLLGWSMLAGAIGVRALRGRDIA
jgi:ABC-type transport system involved in multi-copper enzyme maturation permease subunit